MTSRIEGAHIQDPWIRLATSLSIIALSFLVCGTFCEHGIMRLLVFLKTPALAKRKGVKSVVLSHSN